MGSKKKPPLQRGKKRTASPAKRGRKSAGRIFLSFSREDPQLASILYKLVGAVSTPGLIFKADEASASGISPGEDWRDRITLELKRAAALLGLATPRSINSRWLWLETGMVWKGTAPIVLLATPDVRPEHLSPLDHLQIAFLRISDRDLVRRSISKVVEATRRQPRWSTEALALLDEFLALAESGANVPPPASPPPSPSAPSPSAATASSETSTASGPAPEDPTHFDPRARDRATILRLLSTLPLGVVDDFSEKHHYNQILHDGVYFAEGFIAMVSAGEFRLFDAELEAAARRLAQAWHESIDFGDYVVVLPAGRAYRLMSAHEVGGKKRWASVKARFDASTASFDSAYRNFVDLVKNSFPEIDLVKTSDEAVSDYRDFLKDLDERIGRSDEKAAHDQSSRRKKSPRSKRRS